MTYSNHNFGSLREMADWLNGQKAQGLLTMPEPRHLTDEQAITLHDGSAPEEFRIDFNGTGVGGGATGIDVSAVSTKSDLATAVAAAINGGTVTIGATASGEYVKLLHDTAGAAGNVPITQGVGGTGLDALPIEFGIEGMSGGSDAVIASDIIGFREHHERWYLLIDV